MVRATVFPLCFVVLMTSPSLARAEEPANDAVGKREAAVRSRGRFFSKVAVDRDYSGEWVIARTARTTAFLDIMDPRHPRSRAKGDQDPTAIHILVVPNRAREHIAKSLGAPITEPDVKAALEVFADAKRLARRLRIKKANIYANSESRVGVGYLHVHIEGQLPAAKKLPQLEK